MALSILDGNQTATTLSTILSSGQHITAHTVVSLGTQAITDMRGAVSGSVVSISNLPSTQTIAGTVTANVVGTNTTAQIPLNMAYNDETFTSGNRLAVSIVNSQGEEYVTPLPISGTVTIGSALPSGTNRIGVVTIGAGTVTIGAGTAQIGSVTASGTVTANIGGIANSVTLPVRLIAERTGGAPTGEDTLLTCNSSGMLLVDAQSAGTSVLGYDGNAFVQVKQVPGSSVTIGNSVTISSLPALVAGTAQIGSVTASISNTAVTIYSAQGTTVTNSNFTSLTSSTSLVSAVAGRKVLSVFNEGAGNLHISPNATCTTISYQVRLSAGDYWECPSGQLSLAHTAVFATAGTARITEVS